MLNQGGVSVAPSGGDGVLAERIPRRSHRRSWGDQQESIACTAEGSRSRSRAGVPCVQSKRKGGSWRRPDGRASTGSATAESGPVAAGHAREAVRLKAGPSAEAGALVLPSPRQGSCPATTRRVPCTRNGRESKESTVYVRVARTIKFQFLFCADLLENGLETRMDPGDRSPSSLN